eukprot:CAMPEP_0197523286 /NCGR_PEP_ID=MMETSP1318-20131121/8256_1 /TAXON_ID=552666 /ORGANISM="Partenskyella glossopodia, Strain RCC365" /LENGTH=352 /DNA_ID=CAMNT_0043075931 /DNA_START=46 /DNA_END=1101 /DNA_ORIENTATION=-
MRRKHTAGQAQVEEMLASSLPSDLDLPNLEHGQNHNLHNSKDNGTQKGETAVRIDLKEIHHRQQQHPRSSHQNQRVGGSDARHVSEIKFTKEHVGQSLQSDGTNTEGGTTSALTSILEKREEGLEDEEVRYRARSRSTHVNDADSAVQAARAYNITIASREHLGASPSTRESSSFYIGSTPAPYNPHLPGTYQMSDKFRCTVHLGDVAPICRKFKYHTKRISSEEIGSVDNPRERTTSANNPSSIVGMSSVSYVQLLVSRQRTAEEIVWKALKAYLKIVGLFSNSRIDEMKRAYEFRLWLGEEDGSIDESAPPLHDGRVITETGCDNFVVRCNLRGKNKKTSNGNPRRRKSW